MTDGQPPSNDVPQDQPGRAGHIALGLVESLNDPVYAIDRSFRIVFFNDAFRSHMGMAGEALMGASVWEGIPPAQRGSLQARFQQVMDTGAPEFFVQESVVYPGRMVDVRVFPAPGGAAIIFRDITRRITAERALATSEEHLRRALLGADMGDWSWDASDDRMTFSERALAIYGIGPESQGMSREALRQRMLHPDDVAAVRQAAQNASEGQSQYEAEYRVRHGDGWRWMRVMGGPHVVEGRIVGMHGLVQDIHERKLAETRLNEEIEERGRAQQRQTLLIHELNHRAKNLLAMVQAIAAQTLSAAPTPEAARIGLEQRISALARAHDVLTRESWDGAELSDIISGAVAPYESQSGQCFRLKGPRVRLEPKTAVSLAMALHELATNAVKYGALSARDGFVDIGWTAKAEDHGVRLALDWTERGGPPVRAPDRTGFGTRLITRSLAAELGAAEFDYRPEGLTCRISALLT